MRITGDEQKLITSLVPLLPTPRIAKRLVNIHQRIKATNSPAEVLLSRGKAGRVPACSCSPFCFGRPSISNVLLRALQERTAPFDDPDLTLLQAVQARSGGLAIAVLSREQREQQSGLGPGLV